MNSGIPPSGTSEEEERHYPHKVRCAGQFVFYNFMRQHQTLRMPAMAAGVAERLWSMEDVAVLTEARAPKPGQRRPYRSKRADCRRMPTVHLIHGFLGAGKTTFARRLEADLPAIRFTHDEWMARLYGDDPPMEQYPEYFRRVSDQIGSVWPRCAELGLDVVLDLGFWSRTQRDETRAFVVAIGATPRLYRLVCSDDEAWRRIDRRNADLGGGLFIARNTFEVLKDRFEPLDSDEECVEIPSANSN